MEKTKVAVIIQHPYRNGDFRVDIIDVDESWSDDEIIRQIEREMVGPFKAVAISRNICLNRPFPFFSRVDQKIEGKV